MVAFLENQLSLLEREKIANPPDGVPAEQARGMEDWIAVHLVLLERMEQHLGQGGLCEQDRPLVPLFRKWLALAGTVKAPVRWLVSRGCVVRNFDPLMFAVNRAKPIAEDFDYWVQRAATLMAGGDGQYLPLSEMDDALQRQLDASGQQSSSEPSAAVTYPDRPTG